MVERSTRITQATPSSRATSGRAVPPVRVARRVRAALPLLGILVVASNLRAPLAGYPPLLATVRSDLGLSSGVAGFVQAAAVLAMAAGSFGGVPVAARVGSARALGAAVGLVGLGCLLRGLPTAGALLGGTLLVGLGIGTAGVFLAGVTRERFAAKAGLLTGGYVVAMMIGATVSSGLAVPLAGVLGGWSRSLGIWAVPALLAAVLWTLCWAADRRRPERLERRPARQPDGRREERTSGQSERPAQSPRAVRWTRLARLAAAYQAGTSLLVYGWMTWLAPYYQAQGWAPSSAGLLLAAWSVAQVPAALVAPALAQRRRRWRFWASVALGCAVVGTLGVLFVPVPPVLGPWPWLVLIGLGSGAGFPLGLTVIAWRTPDGTTSAATSGLALGIGYTVAGLGPLAMGLLVDLTGGYPAAIAVLLAGAAVQGWAIGRIGDRPAPA